jgi:hypothetical protein
MMYMVGHDGHEVVEMVEAMGLQYEVCYYDDDVTLAGVSVYGIDGCDSYEYECDEHGMVEAEGEFFYE